MATIRITNLKLRAVIGTNDWERECKQDVIINIRIDFDASKASLSDNIKDTIDYKAITKDIIQDVESSQYFLLEKLAKSILKIVMKNPLAIETTVRVDKPLALRFTDSVSVEISEKRES
ncbi:MAG: dihydroneopterin aldolase [Candidatus Omnitrophica bacterium]|nr:dihydroneopterin aldolase [Candidatus Omnitrophota bacterium]